MHPKHFSLFLSLHPKHFSPFLSLCHWFSLSHSVSLSFSFSLFLTYIVVLCYTMPIKIVNKLGLTFMIYKNINFHGFRPLFNQNCRHFAAVYECIPSVIGSCLARASLCLLNNSCIICSDHTHLVFNDENSATQCLADAQM